MTDTAETEYLRIGLRREVAVAEGVYAERWIVWSGPHPSDIFCQRSGLPKKRGKHPVCCFTVLPVQAQILLMAGSPGGEGGYPGQIGFMLIKRDDGKNNQKDHSKQCDEDRVVGDTEGQHFFTGVGDQHNPLPFLPLSEYFLQEYAVGGISTSSSVFLDNFSHVIQPACC